VRTEHPPGSAISFDWNNPGGACPHNLFGLIGGQKMEHTEIKNLPTILTVEEIAKILRVGRNTAYRLVQEGNIRCIHCGRKIIIPRESLEKFLSEGG